MNRQKTKNKSQNANNTQWPKIKFQSEMRYLKANYLVSVIENSNLFDPILRSGGGCDLVFWAQILQKKLDRYCYRESHY